jgi:hypothetical protein
LGWDGKSTGPRLRTRKARVTFSDDEEEDGDEGDGGDDGDDDGGDKELYCVCRKPSKEGELMVACDACDGWFHPACVGLDTKTAQALPSYTCESCRCVLLQCVCASRVCARGLPFLPLLVFRPHSFVPMFPSHLPPPPMHQCIHPRAQRP